MKSPAFRHIERGDVVSTNAECMALARHGDPGGVWVTASRQSGGRGRRGRAWVSEPGNLYASLLLINPAPWAAMTSLPLAVTLAVYEAIAQVLADDDKGLEIKWPNDVLIEGRKTCGILIEAEPVADNRKAVVIGCGVNIAHRPDAGLYDTICLSERGSATTPQDLFARLVVSMDKAISKWDQGRGLAEIREAWLARAGGIGRPITVNLPDRQIDGLFHGIDASGRLVLETPDGNKQMIASGDVFFTAASDHQTG